MYYLCMHVQEFDRLMRAWMPIDELAGADSSLNGLQVAGSREEIRRVALAVDASLETFRRAAEWPADLLFVHHGMFWGREQAVTGAHYRRIRFLIESGLALYAAHLPLDMQPEFGNNAALARRLGLAGLEPFGTYRGLKIGFKGRLDPPLSLSEIAARLGGGNSRDLGQLPFGPDRNRSVGIVSGGAAEEVHEAIGQGLDLYVTGDASHQVYHACLEGGINVLFGGHYATEQWGVRFLAEKLTRESGLETLFIDLPTGL